MLQWTFGVLFIAVLAWGTWAALRTRSVFEIRIEQGRPRLHSGKVTREFLDTVADVCREAGLQRGWIRGVRQNRRIALRFSRHIPPDAQQRLRNAWQACT